MLPLAATVAYVCDAISQCGGGELVNRRLTDAMRRRGAHVDVVVPKTSIGGVAISSPLALYIRLRQLRPAVAVLVGPSVNALIAALCARILRLPFVYFFFGDIDWESTKGRLFAPLHDRVLLGMSQSILTLTRTDRLASRLEAMGMSPRRITVTTIACDVPLNERTPGAISNNTMLFIGGIDAAHAYKRPDLAIRALTLLADQEVTLEIIGRGEPGALRLLAESLNVAHRVRFLGGVSEEEKLRRLRSARMLILPSPTSREGFGIVVIEAMRLGVPVVVGAQAGSASLVEETGLGATWTGEDPRNLAETAARVLSMNAHEIEEGWRRFRALSDRFSWDRMAEQVLGCCFAVS